MCLNCGCGKPSDTHGNPLNLTMSRLKLTADRDGKTVKEAAMNIVATVLGKLDDRHPLGND